MDRERAVLVCASVSVLQQKFQAVRSALDERARRLWAAAEARSIGWRGVSLVARATGMSRTTITAGLKDLGAGEPSGGDSEGPRRVRRVGAGRKRLVDLDPRLTRCLESLVEPATRGDPRSPLRWTCKSVRRLSGELTRLGHPASSQVVSDILRRSGYSLQANRKTREGRQHPDRNEQFEYINAQASRFQRRGQPVISVDTKKKELVGDFKNAGREWRRSGHPEQVRVHDFLDPVLGKAIPYGVYDVAKNLGWVSVGSDHDTAQFAVETIRRWWARMGLAFYPGATDLLVLADGGGSNGHRSRLWKVELQKLADATGLRITVSHFPPGTSKWNKIEHRMFSHITQNWRGRPLISHQVIVELIGATTTRAGLRIKAALDKRKYRTGLKVTQDDLARVRIKGARFHGDWNYRVLPHTTK